MDRLSLPTVSQCSAKPSLQCESERHSGSERSDQYAAASSITCCFDCRHPTRSQRVRSERMRCRTQVPWASLLLVRSGIAHHVHGCLASGSPNAHADPPWLSYPRGSQS